MLFLKSSNEYILVWCRIFLRRSCVSVRACLARTFQVHILMQIQSCQEFPSISIAQRAILISSSYSILLPMTENFSVFSSCVRWSHSVWVMLLQLFFIYFKNLLHRTWWCSGSTQLLEWKKKREENVTNINT